MCYNKLASRREMCQERDKVQDYLMTECSILSKPSTGWTKFPVWKCQYFNPCTIFEPWKKRPISFTDLCVYTGANVMLSGTKNRAANVGECLVSQVGKKEIGTYGFYHTVISNWQKVIKKNTLWKMYNQVWMFLFLYKI